MKLVRYGEAGNEKPGVLDSQGAIRDLSGIVKNIDGTAISDQGLQKLRGLDISGLPKVAGNPRLGPLSIASLPQRPDLLLRYGEKAVYEV